MTKRAYSISDAESFSVARELLQKEGILAGSSTGTLLASALRYCREQKTPKRVVTLACDTGARYLSKLYNDFWMEDQGFIQRETYNDLRDLIGRPHGERATITVGPNDVLTTAHNRLRNAGFSQLPVMDGDKLIGVVTEDDILRFAFGHPGRFNEPVHKAMTSTFLRVDKSQTHQQSGRHARSALVRGGDGWREVSRPGHALGRAELPAPPGQITVRHRRTDHDFILFAWASPLAASTRVSLPIRRPAR